MSKTRLIIGSAITVLLLATVYLAVGGPLVNIIPGRFAVVSVPDGRDGQMTLKVDRMTGRTWKYSPGYSGGGASTRHGWYEIK